MNHTLVDTLTGAGKPAHTWTSPDGSTVLLLPYGGRILGLFAPGSDQNFLWTHPALNSPDSARAFFQSTEWHNSGGDRTWLSPEVDFFFPKFPRLDTYVQPREFDPGNYRISHENGSVILVNRFTARLSRSGHTVHLEVTKRLAPAQNPLRYLRPAAFEQLAYAGYTLRTRLEFVDHRAESTPIGLWSLLQLPHGGELLIPTFSRSAVKTYMGQIEACDLTATEHLIRYRMRAVGEHKLGVQAPTVIGRVGYLYSIGPETCLVIRNFSINPSGEYVDVPWLDTDCSGSAIEACNVNSDLGIFSELEYHAPAIGGTSADSYREDESQVWAFSGRRENILEVARLLISSEL